jgi:hypothetical protein
MINWTAQIVKTHGIIFVEFLLFAGNTLVQDRFVQLHVEEKEEETEDSGSEAVTQTPNTG